jgi:hypothetical protein
MDPCGGERIGDVGRDSAQPADVNSDGFEPDAERDGYKRLYYRLDLKKTQNLLVMERLTRIHPADAKMNP